MLSRPSQYAPARTVLGWLSLATLAACLLTACDCDDNGGSKQGAASSAAKAQQKSAADATEKLNKRCEQLGQKCGQKDKHKEQITKECKEAAKSQVDKGCVDLAVAAYDCYEKQLCGEDERIWALDDFRVLVERHDLCVKQREAAQKCVTGSDKK